MRLSLPLRKYYAADQARLALWVPVLTGFGVCAYFLAAGLPPAWFGLAALLLAVGLLLLAWRAVFYRTLCLAAFWLVLGLLLADYATREMGTPMLTRAIGIETVTGTVRDIQPQDQGVRLLLDVTHIENVAPAATPIRVRLSYRMKDALPPIGAKVACTARLLAISAPVVPGGYDFRRHHYFAQVGATGFVVRPCTVLNEMAGAAHTQEKGFSATVAQLAASGRMAIRTAVTASLHDDDAAAITEALLTGVQQGISDRTMEAMRVSGLVHILSVSGLHIGLAAGIVFFVLRALFALVPAIALRWPIKKLAAFFAFLSALAYTVLVGAPIPAVRSLLMLGLMLLAVLLDRPALSLRVVAVAAVAVLLLYPPSVLSPSFQLSFAAITAIMALVEGTERWREKFMTEPYYFERWRWVRRLAVYFIAAAATSVVATLATMPFTYYHFQQVNAYGLLANMLAMPLASFWLMPMVVVTFLAMPLGLAAWPLELLGQGVNLLIAIATGVASLPGADWQVPAMPAGALAFIVLGGLWLLLWRARWRWWGLAPIAAGVLLAALSAPQPLAFISADGKYAALLADDKSHYLLASTSRAATRSFTVQQWQNYTGSTSFVVADDAAPACNAALCKGHGLTLLRDPNALVELCESKAGDKNNQRLLVPSIGVGRACRNVMIDNWDLYRRGAALVDPRGHMHFVADDVGRWPWSAYESGQHRPPANKRLPN